MEPAVFAPEIPAPRDFTAADIKRVPTPAAGEIEGGIGIPREVWLALGAAIVLIGAPLAGFTLGRDDSSPAEPATVRGGTVSLEHDGSWSATSARVAGLDLAQPIALRNRGGVKLSAGRLKSYPPGFQPVPLALRERFSGRTNQATIRLGSRPARRYTVGLRSGGPLWLALAPDSKGWVAIACEGPGADKPGVCPAVASSLQVRDAAAVPVGPVEEVATDISASLTDLNGARGAAQPRLRVRSATTRASAARRLAAAHERAAATLTGIELRPQERALVERLARALRIQSQHLERLAQAAARRQFGRYDTARRTITRQEGNVRAAVRRLASIGYDAT